jgi:hypothetical protein
MQSIDCTGGKRFNEWSDPSGDMDRQKVEENVAKFVSIGFTRAREQVNGYPLVYRMQQVDGFVICREIHIVNEDVSPEIFPHAGE